MTVSVDDVTVISVTYKSREIVDALVGTLERFAHVIVVDNASADGTAEEVARRLPTATVLANTENLGFGQANNQAVALVQTPYALLLNPDCDITPEAVGKLVDALELYPTAAVVAPQSWHDDGLPQMAYRHAFYEQVPKQPYRIPDGAVSAKWLHGCCLLVRVPVFRAIGGFDKRFFLYYEDDDLCLQVHAAGYECLCVPDAHALHLGGASSTPSVKTSFKKNFNYLRSRYLAIDKYLGSKKSRMYLFQMMLVALFAVPLYALLLQRKHCIKWVAWGCSAWLTAFKH